LHEPEAFIWQGEDPQPYKIRSFMPQSGAFKAEAIVYYASALITQQMEASGSPFG